MNDSHELSQALEFALEIAREAGSATLEYFQREDLGVASKDDGTPVTQADRAAESLLRARLTDRFPADGILGEEEGETPGTSGRRWILDPIDGTVSFARGIPLFGTLIGLEVDGEATVGVIHMPALEETVGAARGLGARWYRRGHDPVPARVSETKRLDEAMFCWTTWRGFRDHDLVDLHAHLCSTVKQDRGWNDCYAHLLVATGRADFVVEPVLEVWDCAALAPVLSEAGGTFTDLSGVETIHHREGLATNGHLLEQVLELLRAARRTR